MSILLRAKKSRLQQAIAVLRRLTRSPAGVYTPGLGYLQTPANLLTWSMDFSQASWTVQTGAGKASATSITLAASDNSCVIQAVSDTCTNVPSTFCMVLSGTGTMHLFAFNPSNGYMGSTQVTLTSTPTLYALNFTATVNGSSVFAGWKTGDTATAFTSGGAGLFAGTFSASQLQAMGGIPWTMGTAGVALSLGPNLVTNGDFSNGATGWILDPSWSVSGGVATKTAGAGANVVKPSLVSANKPYQATFTTALSAGSVFAYCGDAFGTSRSANGTYTQILTPTVTSDFGIAASAPFAGSVDDITLREIVSTPCPVYTDAHIYQFGGSQKTYGPELNAGAWSTSALDASGGSTYSSGTGRVWSTDGTYKSITQFVPVVVGKTYRMFVTVVTITGASPSITIGLGGSSGSGALNIFSPGTYYVDCIPSLTSATFEIKRTGGGNIVDATVANVTITEVITSSAISNGLSVGNYKSANGSDGFAAVDGNAGLILDGMGSLGAELMGQSTLDLTTVFWAKGGAVATPSANVVNFPSANSEIAQTVSSVNSANKSFLVTVTLIGTGTLSFGVTNNLDLAVRNSVTLSGVAQTVQTLVKQNGTASSNAGVSIIRSVGDTCTTATITSVSWKEVTGIHASGATPPVQRRGLKNIQPYSNDLTNVGWGTFNTAKVAGSLTRSSTVASCFSNAPAFASALTVGTKFTVVAKVKAKSVGGCIGLRPSGTYPDRCDALFNLNTGTLVNVGAVGGFSGPAASIAGPDANGFYLCVVSGTVGGTPFLSNVLGPCDSAAAYTAWEATSSVLSDCYIESLGTIPNVNLTAQQIIEQGGIPTTTTVAASNPSAGLFSGEFNGSQSLLAGSFGFTSALTIVIAGRLDSLAASSVLLGENVGGVQFIVSSTGAIVLDKAATGAVVSTSGGEIVAGVPFVITCRLSGGTFVIRKNGVQKATLASGTTFSAATGARIGADFNSALACTGSLSQVIAMPYGLTDAECLAIERIAASNTPGAPRF